ncbi:MAG TPA: DUF983 domain-containing protein [Ornithinibacter sp.]|nr:DUF983 domain-containing protein [Ornithinibacter sp.]
MDPPDPKPLTNRRLVRRGLLRRCPLCGGGDMFETFFQVRDRCPRCNFPIQREEGHWLGAVGINTIVTFTLLFVTMAVSFLLTIDERRALPILVPCFLVAGLTPLLFFGSSQTLWSAIDLAMRPLEPADDVDPRWIPPPVRRRW